MALQPVSAIKAEQLKQERSWQVFSTRKKKGDTMQIGADFNTLISTWLYKRKLTNIQEIYDR